jgi:hypothetical protein
LELGCKDPVERIAEAKARDPHRQNTLAIFEAWSAAHGATPMKAADLAEPVLNRIDPQHRGRQYVAAELGNLAGTRVGGFVLDRQKGSGRWSAATYLLQRATADGTGHREDREHRPVGDAARAPMRPMPPMPYGHGGEAGGVLTAEPAPVVTVAPAGSTPDDEEFTEWTG